MKVLRLILIIAVLALPAIALAQNDSMVIDTTVTTQSPLDFEKVLQIDNIAKFFGVNPFTYLVFVAMISVLCVGAKEIKSNGQYFFTNNRSFALPFLVGIPLAYVVPLGFDFWFTLRFGIQGAIGAMLFYILTGFMHRKRE